MLNGVIDCSLRHRFLVILAAAACAAVGGLSLRYLDIDAFPDTTPVQVQINTVDPALAPEQVEQLITFPIEYTLGGLKGLQEVRSVSKFGISQVVALFTDDTDIYFARMQINERLGEIQLPAGIARPTLGPRSRSKSVLLRIWMVRPRVATGTLSSWPSCHCSAVCSAWASITGAYSSRRSRLKAGWARRRSSSQASGSSKSSSLLRTRGMKEER